MDVRRLAAVAVTLPLLVLSACVDEGSGKEPSPAATSISPTPTVTDAGPSIPPEAVGDDEESAKAFVEFYFDTLSEAMVTGDTTRFEELALPRCESCASLAKLIRSTYRKGGRYETSGWKVQAAVSLKWPGVQQGFVLRTRQAARTLLNAENEVVDRTKSELVAMRIILRPREETWVVQRLDLIQ